MYFTSLKAIEDMQNQTSVSWLIDDNLHAQHITTWNKLEEVFKNPGLYLLLITFASMIVVNKYKVTIP